MSFLVGIMRYIAPITAIIILLTCVISLFRNRPRVHKMAQLVYRNSGEVIDIDHWETSIGKSRSNDIVLNYPQVSRFHAVIAKKKRDWLVTDTFSKTGVFVNGEPIVNKEIIEDGDIISIGGIELVFQCDEAVSAQRKQDMRNAVVTPVNNNVAYGVLVDVKTKKPIYLKKKDVLIGRNQNCDIKISSQMVSASHARIYMTSRGWALVDLDSHNGTKLNGRFINQPQLIFDEDLITFGDRVFVFYDK
jgi:pSer/pThr/pTyr-binding forkhead associated (FHA) protein